MVLSGNLEKNGIVIDDKSVNMSYLNSYYQKYKNILPKSERGKFPRPIVSDSKEYRSIIDEKVNAYFSTNDIDGIGDEILYDFQLANQHEKPGSGTNGL